MLKCALGVALDSWGTRRVSAGIRMYVRRCVSIIGLLINPLLCTECVYWEDACIARLSVVWGLKGYVCFEWGREWKNVGVERKTVCVLCVWGCRCIVPLLIDQFFHIVLCLFHQYLFLCLRLFRDFSQLFVADTHTHLSIIIHIISCHITSYHITLHHRNRNRGS